MSKVGDKVLTEKTRVMVTMSNFVMLIFTIISGVIFVTNWKSVVENNITNNTLKIESVIVDVNENKTLLTEYGAGQEELKISIARIETHLIYIIDNMKEE